MKKVLSLFLILIFLLNPVFAQNVTSSETPSVQTQAEQILNDLNNLIEKLQKKKGRANHIKANKIALIKRKLVRAVNSNPPAKCYQRLKIAINNLYGLVSELGSGISCGPPIIPPFFLQIKLSLAPDCLPPDITPDQLDETFVDLNPIYDNARALIKIDDDSSEIPDVCEQIN